MKTQWVKFRGAYGRIYQVARRNWLNVVVFVGFGVVLVSTILPLLSWTGLVRDLDTELQPSSDVMVFLSTIYTAWALIIALAAYMAASRRPKLRVRIIPNSSVDLILGANHSGQVSGSRLLTQWKVIVSNTGRASARYTVVQLTFEGLVFNDSQFPGWENVLFANAAGWYAIRWSAGVDKTIHPNFPLEIPELNFAGSTLVSRELAVVITVAADGFDPATVKRPIHIIDASPYPPTSE